MIIFLIALTMFYRALQILWISSSLQSPAHNQPTHHTSFLQNAVLMNGSATDFARLQEPGNALVY
jgi:hypothetical protein